MRKKLVVPATMLGMALLASCNLNSSDEGKNEVSNFEDLPNCSEKGSTSGTSPLGEKVRVEEEEMSYVCTDSGWVIYSVAEYDRLPTCTDKGRKPTVGMNVYVDADSANYLCLKTGWRLVEGSDEDAAIEPTTVLENRLVKGSVSMIGPFVAETPVTLAEIYRDAASDSALVSDSVYVGAVSMKLGQFVVPNVLSYSDYMSLKVTGSFKDPLTGEASDESVELSALVKVGDVYAPEINIDVADFLMYKRILKLANDGYRIDDAIVRANKELFDVFGYTNVSDSDSAAAKLAIGLLLRSNVEVKDFVELVTEFAEDFAEDGLYGDDEKMTQLGDFAFNIQNWKIKDEETGEVLLKQIDYRKRLESFGIKNVPEFESFFTDFWVASYGLGGCGMAREYAVVKNANEDSDSASAYFMCEGGAWRVATDYERDTVGLGNAEDGVLHEGNVNKKKLYVFDTTGFGTGETRRWQEPDSIVLVIGKACTDFEEVAFTVEKTKDKKNNENYYGCQNRKWNAVSVTEYEIGYLCHESTKNVAEKYKHEKEDSYARCREDRVTFDDGTEMVSYFWETTLKLDYEHRDEDCNPYEIKGSKTKYYCTDADKPKFVEATEDEAELGVCYEATFGTIDRYKKDGADVYRQCSAGYIEGTYMWNASDEHTYNLQAVCNEDSANVFKTYKDKDDKDVYVYCADPFGTGMWSWTATDPISFKMERICDANGLGLYGGPDGATYACGCEAKDYTDPLNPVDVIGTQIGDVTAGYCSEYGPFNWYKQEY